MAVLYIGVCDIAGRFIYHQIAYYYLITDDTEKKKKKKKLKNSRLLGTESIRADRSTRETYPVKVVGNLALEGCSSNRKSI